MLLFCSKLSFLLMCLGSPATGESKNIVAVGAAHAR